MPGFFKKLKRVVREPGYLKVLLFGATMTPANPAGFSGAAPHGLALLHVAGTMAEAEMLRQVLTEAEFHVEYVAGAATGIFGTAGNNSVYVQANEFEHARAFLDEYFAAEPLPDE